MDAPGGRDERRTQQERLRREEAYYHFINGLSEEEYRLMRDSNLLGTPGEVTAEELRQRLNGAKERLSAQTHPETRPQNSSSLGEDGTAGGVEAAVEASNGDSLLEWLNTFRRTGNATRSGQSGNQTWRAVSRTNPNSGEFRFSLEININHEQPESGDLTDQPGRAPPPPPGHADLHSPALGRRPQTRRTRSGAVPPLTLPLRPPPTPSSQTDSHSQRSQSSRTLEPQSHQYSGRLAETQGGGEEQDSARHACPRVLPDAGHQGVLPSSREPRSSRTRARGRGGCRSRAGRASRRSRSPLHRLPDLPSGTSETGASQPAVPGSPQSTLVAALPHSAPGASQPTVLAAETQMTREVAMETGDQVTDPAPEPESLPLAESAPEAGEEEAQAAGGGGGVRRHPTIMLDLQVRRIRPGETRDRDSIASRTRSRLRMAENTVTFESDSGGFRRTISRSERAGVRTYVSTIRIPLRRISETGLGEPSSTALRSILRQIMTGFGELSSLMETEADAEEAGPASQTFRIRGNERSGSQEAPSQERRDVEGEARVGADEEVQGRLGGTPADARPTSRDTNNLVENGTLPILRLAHFFLLNDEEDEEHPRGLTKEQIDNLSTRTYGQASLEGELGRACSICISEYAQGNKLRRLPCAHEFHIHCIDRWLSENNTCPICRQPILPAHQG